MNDWNDLRHFLAVAREGSTLAAAKVLRVNQSTVHRHVSALERDLECKLVERHPTGYRLTDLGKELRAYAERMDESAAALERHVASSAKGMTGCIRVTCSTAVGHRLMKSGLVDRFTERGCDRCANALACSQQPPLCIAVGSDVPCDADSSCCGNDPEVLTKSYCGLEFDEDGQSGVLLQGGLVESGCFMDFNVCHDEGGNLIQLLIDLRVSATGSRACSLQGNEGTIVVD